MNNSEKGRDDYRYETAISDLKSSGRGGALKNYMKRAVGSTSFLDLIRYELITGFLSSFPGGPGYLLRQKFYPCFLGKMGRGVTIGRNVTIRGPKRIQFGNNVFIEDNCTIDAFGKDSRIILGSDIIVARDTIIRSRGGDVIIDDGTSIGSKCIIATDSRLVIGKDVLIAAFCYLSGGGSHNYDDTTIPIIKQDVTRKGGIVIGDGAWIGAQTVIVDGAKVNEGAIIGTSSLVNKEMPAMSISFGTPAKVVRMRGESNGSPPRPQFPRK